ncbi:MAG: methyltransferase domain-containing protein [Bacteroidales bacterium]|nr:methyltransferase domain-containing protein [Bacteroidales bacterium]
MDKVKQKQLFDDYSLKYHQTLNDTLKVTGENSMYFCCERVKWMKQKISNFFPEHNIKHIIDYGCGTGDTIPIINEIFKPLLLTGIDISVKSIDLAKAKYQTRNITFYENYKTPKSLTFDLAYCNGVFHHIPIHKREKAINHMYSLLSEKAICAFWENNPWNLGTQYLMNKCPFDKDAITLSFNHSKQLLKKNGFNIVDVSFCFVFPKAFSFMRFSEKLLSKFPIGAQYLILAQKE